MPDPDHLSNEVSITFNAKIPKLPDIALSIGARSRFIASMDRLLGSIPDLVSAPFEGWAAKRRARDANEVALVQEKGKAAIASAYTDAQFGSALAERFLKDEARKQINREAVAVRTIEQLQASEDLGENEGAVDEDWLNTFTAAAENASSDRLRDIWSRVLSGEIKRPGSFSLSTIRFFSELDSRTAEVFQKHLVFKLNDSLIKKETINPDEANELFLLVSMGLLHNFMGYPQNVRVKSDRNSSVYLFVGELSLFMKATYAELNFTWPVIPLTRTGIEVARILPSADHKPLLMEIFEKSKNRIVFAELRRVIGRLPDGEFKYETIEVLKSE